MQQDTFIEISKELKAKYKKQTLTLHEVAKELSMSSDSLRAGIRQGINVPNYRVIGTGEQRKKVIFPINEVAKFLANLVQVY